MTQIAEEYSQALFALAAEQNVKREVADSVKALRDIMSENIEYTDLLASPNIPMCERCELIDKAFGEFLHEYAVSFLKLLCERGHIRDFSECAEEFLKLYEASDGIVTAHVTSAAPFSDAQLDALREKLQKKLSRKVELVCDVDTSILGGFIVRADGNIMDASLKAKLAKIGDSIGN